MDVRKLEKKKKNLWIFDETFEKETVGVFLRDEEYLTNANKKETVFVLAIEGNDYMIMPFKLDYTALVEEYGSNTDDWRLKHFSLSKNSKGKYRILPIEEKI